MLERGESSKALKTNRAASDPKLKLSDTMGSKSRIILTAFLVSVYLVEEIASEPRWGWSRRRRQCYKQNCVPGQWSKWSPCSHSCGPHGHSRATRPIIRPASCGGTCLVTTVAAKACNRFCLNGGTLIRSSCYCKSGYSGECCEKGELFIHWFLVNLNRHL